MSEPTRHLKSVPFVSAQRQAPKAQRKQPWPWVAVVFAAMALASWFFVSLR
jgi:hypothetical protein